METVDLQMTSNVNPTCSSTPLTFKLMISTEPGICARDGIAKN